MKILHITTHLNKGGIASYLSSLVIELKKRGHDVIVASSDGDLKTIFLKNDIKYLRIPIKTKQEISPSLLFSYFILKKFLSKNSVDLIHAHTRVTQVLAYFLNKKFKIPIVTTCHGFFKPRWHRRKFPCWGNKVVAISNQVKEHLISDFGIEREDVCLIHNGVDLRKFRVSTFEEINTLKKEIGIPNNYLVIGTAARFSEVKGLEYFIRSIPYVLKQNEKVIFLLIGYGKEESKLRQLTQNLSVDDRIVFFKPIKDSYEYIPVIDIFVMPSIQEGLGLSILEAQAQKIPVIASNVGGIPDIIEDNITGLLVEPKDGLAISRAILRLIGDKNLYSKIKENAFRKVVNEFSLEQMVTKTEDLYKELLCHLG